MLRSSVCSTVSALALVATLGFTSGCDLVEPDPPDTAADTLYRNVPASWERSFADDHGDVARAVDGTADGDVLVVGYAVDRRDSSTQMLVFRYDPNGAVRWTRRLGDRGANDGDGIAATPDGGCIALGSNGDDLYVVKLARDGSIEWDRAYSEPGIHYPVAIRADADGYALLGSYHHRSYPDLFVMKLGLDGAPRWRTVVSSPDQEIAQEFTRTTDGGYVATAFQSSTDADASPTSLSAIVAHRFGPGGEILWSQRYPSTVYSFPDGGGVVATPDNGCVLATGVAASDVDDPRGTHVVALDPLGTVRWERLYEDRRETCDEIARRPDGGMLMRTGPAELVETDDAGVLRRVLYLQQSLRALQIVDGSLAADNGYVLVGNTEQGWIGTNSQIVVARYRLPQ